MKSRLKKARQHATFVHSGINSCWSSSCMSLSSVCKSINTSHSLFSWGAINSSLFSPQAILYHKVIRRETCNLRVSFKNADLVAAAHPLSALFGSRSSQRVFRTVFAITLCLSHEACVYSNINPMWKLQTKCKQFCSKVESGKKLSLSICKRLL